MLFKIKTHLKEKVPMLEQFIYLAGGMKSL